MDIISILILLLICAFSVLLVRMEGLAGGRSGLAMAILLSAAAFALRFMCMDHETLDYLNFLTVWVEHFKKLGGFSGLAVSIGNYNVPYLYFLALISYFDIYDLYLIKLVSIFFDVVLAFGVMKLVGTVTSSRSRRLFSFYAVLFLPTVILNSAYWAQCDSIYVAFSVLSIWCALSRRPKTALVLMAVSFSFKLQAVFVMPIFLAFIYTGRMKWRQLPIFALAYAAMILPAVIAGRPFLDTLLLYLDQGSTVGSYLNYNSPSLFALLQNADTALWSKLGIVLAFAFVLLVLYWLFVCRRSLTDQTLLAAAALLVVGTPFLLPHMHDRYFYAADIFTLAFAVTAPSFFLLPLCSQFASLLGYHAYLRSRYLRPMSEGAIALIAVITLLLFYIASHTYRLNKK